MTHNPFGSFCMNGGGGGMTQPQRGVGRFLHVGFEEGLLMLKKSAEDKETDTHVHVNVY